MKQNKPKLAEVNAVLSDGGLVRFIWKTCTAYLVDKNGLSRAIDHRCYWSIRNNPKLTLNETGTTENKDYQAEWKHN